jgi:hypothetical protein
LDNVLTEKWYIPVKQDEAFGICLTAAITLAQENKLDTVVECKKFIETIVPEAFRKVNIIRNFFLFIFIYFSYKILHQFTHGHVKFNVEYLN